VKPRTVFAITMLVLPTACKKPAPAVDAPLERTHVETAAVTEELVPRTLALSGSLRGEREADLAANAAGRVLETSFDRGSEVKQGDILARLDVRAAADAALEASANVAITSAQADAAKRECDRMQSLLDAKAISQAEFDRTADQCRLLPMSHQAAEARAAAATQAVTDGTVRAPFAGVIGERDVEVGDYVRPDSRIATLLQIDPLRLELTVPESAAPNVKAGADLTFSVSGYPGRTFKGTIRFVSPAVREATRDVVVDAKVPNTDRALKPGMFADIRIESGESKESVVPATAVVDKQGRHIVFAVVDGRLEERVVQVGGTKGDLIACVRGVTVGETVVNHPDAKLWNGQGVD
jgi:membrane fusion protein (multidrug efflux system)